MTGSTIGQGRPTGGRVVVVGGGLAGITAALACADAGREVTLLEERARLGGRTFSFRRGDLSVDNGQHVFLRCCTAYRALLDRLGVADGVIMQDRLDIPVRVPGQDKTYRLRRNGLPAPLHLGGSLLRYGPLAARQKASFIRAALAMRKLVRTDPATDARTFGDWLVEHGQDQRTIDAMWDLVGIATLNARAGDASLALAAMVFQVGMLTDASAADIGWARVPLQELHGDAAALALSAAAVTVELNTPVTALEPDATASQVAGGGTAGWTVRTARAEYAADEVVLATPPDAAEKLLPEGAIATPSGWAERLGTSPILNLHLVFDRKVMDGPFVAGVGTPIQWVFDRTGTSGLSGDGQYLAVSVSAADGYIDEPVPALRAAMLGHVEALLPGVLQAELLDFFVTRERSATFRPAPGTAALRASARTSAPGLFLAGAWTDTGWPATMEGAVRSGNAAAAALLARPVREGVAV